MSQIYKTFKVANLPLSPGKMRFARMDDHLRMAQWIVAFSETMGEPVNFEDARSHVEKRIKDQSLHIWDHDGPVSIAGVSRPMRMAQQLVPYTRHLNTAVKDMRLHAFCC